LVLVNDGSTDATQSIAQAFMEQRPNQVRVISTENQGLSRARNNGIAAARGEYLAFLDSDDLWLPEKLKSQVRILNQNHTAQATSCSFVRFDSGEPTRNAVYHFSWSRENVRRWLLLEGSGPALGSTLMIRRSALSTIGLFDSSLGSHAEDLDFACRMVEVATVVGSRTILVGIRVWTGQIHGDDQLMEASLLQIFQSQLSNQPRLAKRALANLHILLASRLLLQGQIRRGAGRMAKSLESSLSRTLIFPWQLAIKRRRNRLRKHRNDQGLAVEIKGLA
jgi:glycosyltransferase involved in cell wall biosynthesis